MVSSQSTAYAITSSHPTNPDAYRSQIVEALSLPVNVNGNSAEIVDLTSHINKGVFISSGGYGDVYLGSWNASGSESPSRASLPQVAIKVMRVTPLDGEEKQAKRIKELRRELRVWQAAQHKNILPLIATACLDGNPNLPAIISPWMENGTIMQYIRKNPEIPREELVLNVIEALEYLHSSKPQIIHGDLKAANVLVDHRGNLYVTDFGLSRMLEDASLWNTSATHAGGTVRWTAPEILRGEQLTSTTQSDLYSFAMTCYEIISGEIPFVALRNDGAVMMAVAVRNERPDRSLVLADMDSLWDLMDKCWATTAELRPTSIEVARKMKRLTEELPCYIEIKSIKTDGSIPPPRYLQCSPIDDKFIATAYNRLYVGDYHSGALIWRFKDMSCLTAQYFPDGSRIAVANYDGIHILANEPTLDPPERNLALLVGLNIGMWCEVIVSPDGKWIASARNDNFVAAARQLLIWNSLTGDLFRTLLTGNLEHWEPDFRRFFAPMAFSYCSQKIAYATSPRIGIQLYDIQRGSVLHNFERPFPAAVGAIAFSPKVDVLIAGYSDGIVITWDASTFQAIRTTKMHSGWVGSVAFSPDGRKVATGSRDETIRVMSTETGKYIGPPLVGHEETVTTVGFSFDGRRIVSGGLDRSVRVWELRD